MSTFASPAGWTRRSVLGGLLTVPVAGLVNGCAPTSTNEHGGSDGRIALVYRGPAGCAGCSEILAERLSRPPLGLDVAFIGPHEQVPLEASALSGATLYAQPGGGDDISGAAQSFPSDFIRGLRDYIAAGGSYLGICMGAYLAGSEGFSLLDYSVEGEVNVPGFPVEDSSDQVVAVAWGETLRWTYFQEGARLPADGAEEYAHYETGDLAAAYYRCGDGNVGLIGPHPEADVTWLEDADLVDPDGDDWQYALPLVKRILS
ncbi:BPL-N domain-containing protein [Brachybacterium sp. p3-SID1565]|uniref:BPL-N domain-containing protein n=1 Tax=Brachybacterium sp. p3-SID1565 TaxID=2916046 RepID=UPI0028833FBA|nr:BPL-N domain-containing protein [Brachybacterium sp. p3-SID1565]